jgi:hypothetical protein
MEERGNKTIMCSVFFLDIVEYSKKSVAGQISLKDRFNSYLSSAIHDVPVTDRIILDTGDGAAINFLGDVEDALKAALNLRESLLSEDADVDPPLLVRMGINLGPVRLVRDINGQPNIVGDGINVAQRVMGFADAAQILVSRSYYDAVSRLSPQYAGMFHYQGSRTDKHVREHEVYAIGYPGDITTHRGAIKAGIAKPAENLMIRLTAGAKAIWWLVAAKTEAFLGLSIARYQQAGYGLRALYIGMIAVFFLSLVGLLAVLARHDRVPVSPAAMVKSDVNDVQPGSAAASVSTVKRESDAKSSGATSSHSKSKARAKKAVADTKGAAKYSEKHQGVNLPATTDRNVAASVSNGGSGAYVQVSCNEGTEVFVDGARKGRISSKSLTISAPPGSHTVIVSNASGGIFTQNVQLVAGKTVHIRPGFCD